MYDFVAFLLSYTKNNSPFSTSIGLRELHWLPVAQRIQYKIAMLVNKCLRGIAPPNLAELCRPVVHLTGRRHLRSAASRKLDVQRTATAIGRRNFAVSGPETWNSLPAELRLSTLSTATFARRLKAHLFVSTEWYVPAARLILLKVALVINNIYYISETVQNTGTITIEH